MDRFASDNYAGMCPEALLALTQANTGFAQAYGNDPWTVAAADRIRELFEHDCDVYFVFNGTAANSLALASLCQSYHSVLCHTHAHIWNDECGGPEFFSNGSKLLPVPGELGQVSVELVEEVLRGRTDIHFPKPKVLSLTQPTEVGTVYSLEKLGELADTAHRFGLKVHMDGARFANAVAALGVSPKAASWKAGVDVLCLGGTKIGLPVGEAVVFFDRSLSEDFAWRCKQAGQLASKMRFIAAPWLGVLQGETWLRYAAHANALASRLAEGLSDVPGVELAFPTEANGVFLRMEDPVRRRLAERGWHFHSFFSGCDARFMCSWATAEQDVDALVTAAREA